ncbi:MAG: hypothetical protein ACI4MS_01630 [Candidatus Coproplasma sp.]
MAKSKLQFFIREGEPVTIKKSLPKKYEIIEHTSTQPAGTSWAKKKGVPLFKRSKSGKLVKNPDYVQTLVVTDEELFTTRIAEDRVYQPNKADRFTTDEVTEKKIKSKEKKIRKELEAQKERDRKSVFVAKEKSSKTAPKTTCKPKTAKSAQTSPKISKSAQTSPKTTSKPADATSYTVKQGRTSKTFKTKSEAQTCASQSNKKATITKTNKKPTHKIVKFTARV